MEGLSKGERDKILECLYEKTYTCPVCDNIFKNKTVKIGKAKLISTDIELKPKYEPLNPMFYSIVSCQLCGYTSLDVSFDKISLKQSVIVRQILAQKFVARQYPEIYDANTAIIRYKLALICADLKKAKLPEFAHIALRLSWFYNELGNFEKEKEFTLHAFNYFESGLGKESFSLYGYDDNKVIYTIASLAYKLEDYDKALKYLSSVISSRNILPRLKEKAIDLRDIIKDKR